MEEKPKLINLNTADIDDLMTLPGVASTMAERIIAARPFNTIEELQRVSGIGQVAIDRWRPLIAQPGNEQNVPQEETLATESITEAEPSSEDEPVVEEEIEVETMPEGESEELPTEPEPELEIEEIEPPLEAPSVEEEERKEIPVAAVSQPIPDEPKKKTFTRSQVGWLVFWSSLFTFLMAIAVSMGLLALINGGLQYANPSQVSTLRRGLDGLNAQTETLGQDISGLRTRIDKLEGLSGRVAEVEKAAGELRSDFDVIASQVTQLDASVDELTGTVEELQTRTVIFEEFLNGLRGLLDGLFEPNK